MLGTSFFKHSNQTDVAFHGLNDRIQAAGKDLLGYAESEALCRVKGHMRWQREGKRIHDGIHHHGTVLTCERLSRSLADISGLFNANALRAHGFGDLGEIGILEVHTEGDVAPRVEIYVVCLSLALGLQNGAFRRAGGIGVHTTYLTGTLTNLITAEADRYAAEAVIQPAFPHDPKVSLLCGIWIFFVLGAGTGAAMAFHFKGLGMLGAALPLIILILHNSSRSQKGLGELDNLGGRIPRWHCLSGVWSRNKHWRRIVE